MRSEKEQRNKRDSALRAKLQSKLAADGVVARKLGEGLESFHLELIPGWLIESIVHNELERPDVSANEIIRHPDRFRALIAWCSLTYLHLVGGGAVPAHRTQHPLLSQLKPHSNDFLDAHIAATAAYGVTFVSEDSTLRKRCDFLKERGCIGYETTAIETLLTGRK